MKNPNWQGADLPVGILYKAWSINLTDSELPRNKSRYWQSGGLEPGISGLQHQRPKPLGQAAFWHPKWGRDFREKSWNFSGDEGDFLEQTPYADKANAIVEEATMIVITNHIFYYRVISLLVDLWYIDSLRHCAMDFCQSNHQIGSGMGHFLLLKERRVEGVNRIPWWKKFSPCSKKKFVESVDNKAVPKAFGRQEKLL